MKTYWFINAFKTLSYGQAKRYALSILIIFGSIDLLMDLLDPTMTKVFIQGL